MGIEGDYSQQMLDDRYSPVRYHSHHVSIVAVVASLKLRIRAIQDRSTKGHGLPDDMGASPLKHNQLDSVLREHVSIGWEGCDQV